MYIINNLIYSQLYFSTIVASEMMIYLILSMRLHVSPMTNILCKNVTLSTIRHKTSSNWCMCGFFIALIK